MYIYVILYLYLFACIFVYFYVYIYICLYIYISLYIYVYICVLVYICLYMFIYMYIYIYLCIFRDLCIFVLRAYHHSRNGKFKGSTCLCVWLGKTSLDARRPFTSIRPSAIVELGGHVKSGVSLAQKCVWPSMANPCKKKGREYWTQNL